jgi:Uma2 family endonuclease
MSEAASVPGLGQRMSRDAYRTWAMAQPRGRFERIDGEVVAMAPERANHALLKLMIARLLQDGVKAAGLPCQVFPDGMTVEVDDNDFEPDAILRCGDKLDGNSIAVPDPIVLVEVTSPCTQSIDHARKLAAYFKVPTVRHYLIVSADRPLVIHHRRPDTADTLETRILTTGNIQLDPPGISIAIEALYAR